MQNWNAPEDPPVFSFGYNFNTRTSLSLPSDFPIIPADTTNDTTIASTMWRWETGIFQTVGGYRTRIGTRVRLLRENLSVYTRSVNYYWGNNTECAAYLVDNNQLGGNSELLAVPDFPDQARVTSPPVFTQPAFAVRYKNHYFLPHLHNFSIIIYRTVSHLALTSAPVVPHLLGALRAQVGRDCARPQNPAGDGVRPSCGRVCLPARLCDGGSIGHDSLL
jgi:hypothetical protein